MGWRSILLEYERLSFEHLKAEVLQYGLQDKFTVAGCLIFMPGGTKVSCVRPIAETPAQTITDFGFCVGPTCRNFSSMGS